MRCLLVSLNLSLRTPLWGGAYTEEREGGGESEIGREGERGEIVSVNVMFSLTLAIWEHSDIALLH